MAGDEKGYGTECGGRRRPPWKESLEQRLPCGVASLWRHQKGMPGREPSKGTCPMARRRLVHVRHRETNAGGCSERHLDAPGCPWHCPEVPGGRVGGGTGGCMLPERCSPAENALRILTPPQHSQGSWADSLNLLGLNLQELSPNWLEALHCFRPGPALHQQPRGCRLATLPAASPHSPLRPAQPSPASGLLRGSCRPLQ